MFIAYNPTDKSTKLIDSSQDKLNQKQLLAAQSQKLIQNKGKVYQSPTIFNNLKKKNMNFTYNQNKEDMYALGLTILQLGNGQTVQNIYGKNGEVD